MACLTVGSNDEVGAPFHTLTEDLNFRKPESVSMTILVELFISVQCLCTNESRDLTTFPYVRFYGFVEMDKLIFTVYV